MESTSLSEKLKPRKNGIVGISGEALSIGYFRDTLLRLEAERRMADFIYWPTQNSIILVSSKCAGLRHDDIINALQINPAEAIGGRITCYQGQITTTEWSGHYGDRWTSPIREQFRSLLTNLLSENIVHLPWGSYTKDNIHISPASEFPMPQPTYNVLSSPARLFGKKFKGADLTVLSLPSNDAKSIAAAFVSTCEKSSLDWFVRGGIKRKMPEKFWEVDDEDEADKQDAKKIQKNVKKTKKILS
jgi:hypothetical protein